jgi:hypothetical protein
MDVAARISALVEAELHTQVVEARKRLDAEVDERLRRLSEVTDTLVERAESVSRELDGLGSALRRAAGDASDTANAPLTGLEDGRGAPATAVSPATPLENLEAELAAPAPAAARAPRDYRPTLVGPPTSLPGATAVAEPEVEEPPSDAARLVAVEMALAGSSREEVDRHLRGAFDLVGTGDLLDDVFGR